MDPQDLRRSQSSGNDGHGIHVCHKCGWPFPNPHPSSRHRRTHKKICGTIQGYTHNVDTYLGVSDGDHSDQEDFKTPGTKVVERSNEEKGSGVIGQGSIKSDDGLYSDAVTEFSDTSSPAMTGEVLEDVRGSAPNVETVDETVAIRSNNDGEIAGNQFQECLSSSHLKTSSISDDRNDSESDLHPIKYEMVTNASEDIKINLATDSMIESSLASVEHGRGIPATNPDSNMNLPNQVPNETDEGVSKFEGTVEVTSADEVHNINSGGFVESYKGKEEDNATNVHVLSVPDDIQVVEDPVAMLENFKDHKGKKLDQVPSLDSTEQFDDKENDVKQAFVVEDFNIYPSSHLSGGNVVSSDADEVEPSCELRGCSEPMIKEVPVEDEATMSGNQSSDEKCNLSEDNNKRATEIFSPKVPASNLEPVSYLSELRVNPVANLQQGGDAADDCQKDLTERCDIVGYDGNHEKAEKYTSSGERFTDKTAAETPTSLDSPNSLFELQVHPANNLPYVDGSADHDGVGIETCVASGNESMEGPSGKNLSVESKLTPVSSINFSDPKITVEDASSMKLDEARCSLLDSSSNSSIVGGKIVSDTQQDVLENEIACNDKVQIKAGASAAAGSDHGYNVGSFQKSLENTGMKEPGIYTKDTKSSEDNCSREFHAVAPEFTSQSLEENDDNLVRQQLNSSGIDVSVDSNSRTDSLDANWGSVSGTKVVERSNEEKGSGVIGQGSIKSDDGLYSDAVTEFSDTSSPAMTGEGLEDVRGSAPNVETVDETVAIRSNKDGEIAGNQFQECLSSSFLKTSSISDDRNDSESDLHPIKYEMVTNASEDIKINLATDSMIESSLASVEHGRGIQATNPDSNMNLPNKVPYETDEGVSKFEGTVEVTSADEVHNINSGGFVESCKGKEEDNATNVHVLSVPDDIQVVEDPVAMLENYKDHKGKKLDQVPSLDSTEQFDDKENDVKQPFVVEDFNIYPSSHLSGGNVVSSDADEVEPSCELIGCSEPMIKEVPVEDEATMSGNQSSDEKCNLSEDNNKRATEIFFPKVPASNLEPVSYLSELRVNPVANLQQGGDAADDCQKDLTERCDIVGYDGNHEKAEKYTSSGERFTDKTAAETPTSLDSPNSLFELQVHPANNLPYVDGSADHDGVGIETCVASGNESMEGPSEKNLSVESKLTPVSSINFNDPKITVEDASSMKLDEARCSLLDSSSNSSIVGGKIVSDTQQDVLENEIACNDKVQIKAGASAAAGSDHGYNVGSFQKSLENTGMKEPGISAKDTKSSEDNCSREFHAVAPEFTSQSLEENDDNLVRQQLNSSGIDVSVDSNSRTDSLDANWGSVSVLSMQSDAQAVIDAETVPPTDSQASLEENTDMKNSKAASERHYSDKSDMFEAPSFMTLVENQGGDDNKASGPKIPTAVRSPEQSKTASQTGWFPSLTNVVNESQGRKKNEEIIAKVTNWSTGKQHTPLKSLLGEASQESKGKSAKQNESLAPVPQNDNKTTKVPVTTTVNSILNPDSPTDQAPKKENPKEWNSPVKKPSDNKSEKKKVKGKPYWVHFVCCSSEN